MKEKKDIRFAFMGDIMLGGEFLPFAERNRLSLLSPFKTIDSHLKDADIVFGNLEGPVFKGIQRRERVTTLLSNHFYLLNYLKQFKLCVMNLGNNHIMDYGSEGLNETINQLKSNGIYLIGAGKDCNEAERELVVEVDEMRACFLSYTSEESHIRSVIASKNKPGCASYLNSERVTERVKELRGKMDVVCVSMHWGHEYFTYPSLEQVKIAHSLIDAGATYVIGHHPHVIQGMEEYNGGLIIYSLGNLFFPGIRTISGRVQWQKSLTREFMIVRSKVHPNVTMSVETVGGVVTKDYTLTPFDAEGQHRFAAKLKLLSAPIQNQDYELFWENYEMKRRRELETENLLEAFKKILVTPKRHLVRSLSAEDIWRNLRRVRSIIGFRD